MSLCTARVAPEKAVFRPALPLHLQPEFTGEHAMTAKTYFEKLKDPRWQKVRLQALEAAGWKCAFCNSIDKTLHVHHRQYFKGREPWEYEIGQLEVLCEDCHNIEHDGTDPLLLAASFVPTMGARNRDSAASLIAGFCGHDMGSEYVGDPSTYLAGEVAQLLEEKYFGFLLGLRNALAARDRETVTEAINAFVQDLQTRPDAPQRRRDLL